MRIYIAGPDVFYPDAAKYFEECQALCQKYGHEGFCPFDANVGRIENTKECGLRIARGNEELIEFCDAVIANLTPYHGLHADVGTVYEVGYARAKGKLVFGYTVSKKSHLYRVEAARGMTRIGADGLHRTSQGEIIDDFEMFENAMVAGGVELSGGQTYIGVSAQEGFKKCLQGLHRGSCPEVNPTV